MKFILYILLFLSAVTNGQSLDWQDISEDYSSLPESVKLFKATRENPALEIFCLDIDLNDTTIAVRSYLSSELKTLPSLSADYGTIAAINGGYFGGNVSYSSVIYPDLVKSVNVTAVTRNSKSYPVMRSLFSIDTSLIPSVDWVYHFDHSMQGIYAFEEPISYSYNDPTPKSIPEKSNGTQLNLLSGIGGGPTLIKSGATHITYNEEILWGSGVGLENKDPRTAIGYTKDNHIIMVTADGRQSHSEGVSLVELSEIMIALGCTEAMNLDGGGSSQMTVNNSYVNRPSEFRAIPSIFAVVDRDSLIKKKKDTKAIILDTDDNSTEQTGDGWFETANSGYWGESPALLHPIGNGGNQMKYTFTFDQDTECKVYAWWVAANNRCTDTPYIIRYKTGTDTVRVNQTENHATWIYLGTYTFGVRSQYITVSDAGSAGNYVVADAIKLIPRVKTEIMEEKQSQQFQLGQNFPNPFNPVTTISFFLPQQETAHLNVYDIRGERIKTIISDEILPAGYHQYQFSAENIPSGVYLYKLSTKNFSVMKKMLLVK